jgi:excisionase family DNA binding protein
MKDLRDWYSYLERSARSSPAVPASPRPAPPTADPSHSSAASPRTSGGRRVRTDRTKRAGLRRSPALQERLPIDLGAQAPRRPGRPPLTETREEIIHRLLDPELTVHEAAALLNVSKATLRRYTDSGKLACFRTAGGQRRFKLSAVLSLLEPWTRPASAR